MITPETPPQMLWPAKAISNDQDDELLERALGDLMKQDQWIDDFTNTSTTPSKTSFANNEARPPRLATSFILKTPRPSIQTK
jgi:hypothetical protein